MKSTEVAPESDLKNHGHMVALYFMRYNFVRVHKTLRVTPAMEVGLAHHVRTIEKLVSLIAALIAWLAWEWSRLRRSR